MRPARTRQPDLSAIVVTYNSAPLLQRCLDSLRQQIAAWGGRAEIFVVDNASRDGTAALAALQPDVRLIPLPVNLGFAAGVNAALRRCRAPLVLLHNPDCFFQQGLGSMIRFLQEHPHVAAAGPTILEADGSVSLSSGRFPTLLTEVLENFGLRARFPRSPRWARYLYGDWDRASDRRVDWLTGACLLLRMAALEEVGPLDEDYFLYTEELDLQWRLASSGHESWFLCGPRVTHLGGGSARTHPRGAVYAGRLHREFVRSLTLFFRKHRGPAQARIHRLILAASCALRLAWTLASLPAAADRREHLHKARMLLSVLGGLGLGFGAETAAEHRLRL